MDSDPYQDRANRIFERINCIQYNVTEERGIRQ